MSTQVRVSLKKPTKFTEIAELPYVFQLEIKLARSENALKSYCSTTNESKKGCSFKSNILL